MPYAEPISLEGFPPLYFRAASPREKIATWTRNGSSWSGKLSIPAYIDREHYLGSQSLTKDGQQKYWILTDKAEADDGASRTDEDIGESIYAACETYRKEAWAKDSEGVRSVGHHGIASVFAHPGYRKRGLASAMFKGLTEWFDEAGECEVTTLYSDVGKKFYANLGWPAFPSLEINLPVSEPAKTLESGISLVVDKDVPALCEQDVAQLKAYFDSRPLKPTESALFTVVPSTAQIQWHHARAKYIGKFNTGREPTKRGAKAGENTWVMWNHDFNGNALVVLRVHTPPRATGETEDSVRKEVVEGLKGILLAAETEAAEWGLKSVVVWNPEVEMQEAYKRVENWKNVQVEERPDDSVPSLRWTPKEGREGDFTDKTVWIANEKFAWE